MAEPMPQVRVRLVVLRFKINLRGALSQHMFLSGNRKCKRRISVLKLGQSGRQVVAAMTCFGLDPASGDDGSLDHCSPGSGFTTRCIRTRASQTWHAYLLGHERTPLLIEPRDYTYPHTCFLVVTTPADGLGGSIQSQNNPITSCQRKYCSPFITEWNRTNQNWSIQRYP
jgi:hypothetical protein